MPSCIEYPHDVKARKPHRCELCGKPIDKGEVYISQTCVEDGEVYTFRQCYRCHSYFKEALEAGYDNDNPGYLGSREFCEYMWDYYPDIAKEWWE